MMGTHQSQRDLFNYSVNLDKRVRADHPLRRIASVLDLSYVRPAVAQFYGTNGQVSVDPEVLVKMMLLLFLEDVPSERELMAVIAERLDYMWFLGYGLDEEVPNHSVLSKARRRWGREVFRTLFERTVGQCVAAGLVEGKKLHIDSSLIKANASRDSVVQASPELVAALRNAYELQEQKLEELTSNSVNGTHVSRTDPEATLARGSSTAVSLLSYKHHRVVDDAQGVITAVKTTTGQESDAAQLPELTQVHEQNTGQRANTVVGDKHYGSAENYRYCQSQGIASHLGQAQGNTAGLFPVSQFVYEAEQDRYRCPAGEHLYYHNFKKENRLIEYRIEDAALCANCELRAQCTRSEAGRSVTRPLFSELVEAGREQARSQAARRDMRRRKYLIEGSFADASNNHGFKRARWRQLWRQQIQDWIIAAVQNLRILLKGNPKRANSGTNQLHPPTIGVVQLLTALIWTLITYRCRTRNT